MRALLDARRAAEIELRLVLSVPDGAVLPLDHREVAVELATRKNASFSQNCLELDGIRDNSAHFEE